MDFGTEIPETFDLENSQDESFHEESLDFVFFTIVLNKIWMNPSTLVLNQRTVLRCKER
jgi:hypothetical protein